MQGFGEKLRRQREQRGITLEAISSTTKISTRMLRALEEENFSQLPGGVFNKGFVRAYARQVGLDEEESIADYLAALSESQIKSQTVPPDLRGGKSSARLPQSFHPVPHESEPEVNSHEAPAGVAADENRTTDRRHRHDRRIEARRDEDQSAGEPAHPTEDSDAHHREPWQIENRPAADLLSSVHQEEHLNSARHSVSPAFATGSFGEPASANSSTRVPWATLAAALLIVCVGLAFWNIRRHHHALAAKPSAVTSPEMVPTQTSPAAELTISKLSSANRPKGKLENVTASGVSKPEKISTAPKPPAAMTKSSATVPNNSLSNGSAPDSSAPGSPMSPNARTAVPPSGLTTPAAFTLLIRADQTSWVSITADGKVVAEETLIAPAEKSVRASNQIVVKAGNAAGVSFLFNSKEIPAQGNNGEVRTYTFDASGIKASPGSPPAATPNN